VIRMPKLKIQKRLGDKEFGKYLELEDDKIF
jgi:hypothetical protein